MESSHTLMRKVMAGGITYVELSGQQLIGRRVKIWQPQEGMFYRGKITLFNEEERFHLVHFDNGIREVLDLTEECWLLMKEKEKEIGVGPSNAMIESVGINSTRSSKRKVMEGMNHEGKNKKVIEGESNSNEDKSAPAGPKIYGDIARDCYFDHPRVMSFHLEEVCNVLQKLQSSRTGVTSSQLGEMISLVSDAARMNFHVSWLEGFLEGIIPVDEVTTELRATSNRLVKAAKKDV